MDQMGRALSRRLDFNGRETRRSFWLSLLIWYVAVIAFMVLTATLPSLVTGAASWTLFLAWLCSAVFPIAASAAYTTATTAAGGC
ncbi:MAG: hypothetical protein QOH03_4447 [Kribbellaceae bacterium]|jgi:uncharacterized membrane protein YhaH (DUF805 family)|nr:hypothetical protein [Kribbellaceae bacterium]